MKRTTAREMAMAERKKAIDLIGAAQAGEKEALSLHLAVNAEKDAVISRGEAIRAQADADVDVDVDADRIRCEASKVRTQVEADVARLMNESLKEIGIDGSGIKHATQSLIRFVWRAHGLCALIQSPVATGPHRPVRAARLYARRHCSSTSLGLCQPPAA